MPEHRARELERRLFDAMEHRRAHAVLAIDAQGRAEVRELRVDGEPIAGESRPAVP